MPINYSEENANHRLLVPLPKSKEEVSNDMDEDEEEAARVVAGDSIEDNDDADKDTGEQHYLPG